MDKNMIHIDNLVKQRLSGGEEQERPGAWLHMRDLLDAQMPVSKPAAFGWRRMMTLTAALLALSAIGIGSYSALHSVRNGSKDIAATSSPSQDHTAAKPALNSANGSKGNILTTNDKDRINNTTNATTNSPAKNTNTVKKTAGNTNTNTNNTPKPANNDAAPAKANTIAMTNENGNRQHKNIVTNKLNNNKVTDNTSGNTVNKDVVAASGAHKAARSKADAKIAPAAGNNAPKKDAIAATLNKPGNNKNAAHDSIPAISVNEKVVVDHRSREVHYMHDTVGTGMAVLPATAPAQRPANSIATAANNYNNPRYIAAAAENPNVQTEPSEQILPAAKVNTTAVNSNVGLATTHKARRSGGGGWNFSAVNEFLRNAKQSLGQIQYSSGLIAGFNTVFLNGGMVPGIQLGATETLGISDRISIMFELKYIQSFNRGVVLNDNYVSYTQELDQTWRRDSMEHNYKFSNLQNLSLPVTVRYKAGNFNIFAGGSLVYTLGINPEEVNNPLLDYRKTNLSKPSQEVLDASAPGIKQDNFDARFGIGYILGLSYQLAPKVNIDARWTQSVWDNASTPGAKIVSDRLYKKPGVQLSIGYNLSKEKKH